MRDPTQKLFSLVLIPAVGVIAIGAATWIGCLDSRGEVENRPTGAEACAGTCHGDGKTPAPPFDTEGNSTTTAKGVGAHRAHTEEGSTALAMDCDFCHVVPTATEDPGHADDARPAEWVFNGLAVTGGLSPTYDPQAGTCSETYCHGGSGARADWPSTMVWTSPRPSNEACGTSCHSLPPGGSHPQSDECVQCHGQTAGPGQTIANRTLHINGQVEVGGGACNACHGGDDNDAPPVDTIGNSDPSEVGVGAHQNHLSGGAFSKAVECAACHQIPQSVDDPGHNDTDLPAELVFSDLAVTNGASPVWDDAGATCATVYCHGATLEGGALTTPAWTQVDGSQAVCGSCHGLPPPAPHPSSTTCESCHTATAGPSLSIANRQNHINGTVELEGGACNTCHGSTDNDAPPIDLAGSSDTGDVGVGAHQSHLSGGEFSRSVDCSDCHVVPASVDEATHMDPSPAEVPFGGLAVQDGATPVWDRSAETCSTTYCHGATLGGGSLVTPVWTLVDGSQAVCGSCHGLPPPAPHSSSNACEACHPDTAGPSLNIINRDNHINGTVEASAGCNGCHGSATNDAPPTDLSGSSDTTDVGVGAHQSHLSGGQFSRAVECVECHLVPQSLNDSGHLDTAPADLTFSGVSVQDGATPAWDRSATTCSGTYCHGLAAMGGANSTPDWTVVGGSEASCGSCHALAPPSPHPGNPNCNMCHPSVVDASNQIVDRNLHVNGSVDF